MRYIFDAAVLVIVGYYFYGLITRYMNSEMVNKWDRLLDAAHGSATVLVARLATIAVGITDFIPVVADIFGAQGVSQSIQGVLPTGAVPYYMIAINVLTEVARRRTLPT